MQTVLSSHHMHSKDLIQFSGLVVSPFTCRVTDCTVLQACFFFDSSINVYQELQSYSAFITCYCLSLPPKPPFPDESFLTLMPFLVTHRVYLFFCHEHEKRIIETWATYKGPITEDDGKLPMHGYSLNDKQNLYHPICCLIRYQPLLSMLQVGPQLYLVHL